MADGQDSASLDDLEEPSWFVTKRIREGLYLTQEPYFFEGNRCNIWLIKGPHKDVVIDTGIGVQNLRKHLEKEALIDPIDGTRECIAVLSHVHFDHSGGAKDFTNVLIHELEVEALRGAVSTETLNYVKASHFHKEPYKGFNVNKYKVVPTECQSVQDGDKIDLGQGEYLQVIHVPGHTGGSIIIYYPKYSELYVGDFVYECTNGSNLLDWAPNSCMSHYLDSARKIAQWISSNHIQKVYPGHFEIISPTRTTQLLEQYIESRAGVCSRCCTGCLKPLVKMYFALGCFKMKCCP
ncbi:unnamed protein product [Owenia fusiformis]|uniref:Uncharacterized protein n=1 Tax=Owenia fusiformis TaxID=6347 RepID=A0A8J1XVB9_OWEFU|nr:unnamed protein product [Owenia fusiformis]